MAIFQNMLHYFLLCFLPLLSAYTIHDIPPTACSSISSAVHKNTRELCFAAWVRLNPESVPTSDAYCLRELQAIKRRNAFNERSLYLGNIFDAACSGLPYSNQHSCKEFMFDVAYRLLTSGVDTKIVCHLIQGPAVEHSILTTTTTEATSEPATSVNPDVGASSIACGACVYVTNKIKLLLSSKPVEEDIEKFLQRVCEYLPHAKKHCEEIINKDVGALIHFLSHDVDSHSICTFFKYCEPTEEEKKTPFCPFCEYVIARIQVQIEANTTVDEIKHIMTNACVRVLRWSELCEEIVQTDAPALVDFLGKHYTPRQICEYLKFCPVDTTLPEVAQQELTLRESPVCRVCKPIVHALQMFVAKNHTVEEIEFLLNKLCEMTYNFKDECHQVVDEYLQEMLIELESNTDPEVVCEHLGLCKPKNATSVSVLEPAKPVSICPFCLYLMDRLKREVNEDTSFANIAHYIVRLCPMSGFMRTECEMVVDGNERVIAKLLERNESAKSVCLLIKVCPHEDDRLTEVAIYNNQTEFSSVVMCANILAETVPRTKTVGKSNAQERAVQSNSNDGVLRFQIPKH